LLELYNTIKYSEFINYFVNIENIDENISEFEKLSLENKKRFLIELLDKNLLYKNYSEMNSKTY
jgi:adenine-specific DNA-methyltransferase